MEGGRLLDSGEYGCLYDPPLLCKDKLDIPSRFAKSKLIGKITARQDAVREILAAQVFHNKERAEKYFITPILESYCKQPMPFDQQTEPKEDLLQCKAVSEGLRRYGPAGFVLFQEEYGGISLYRSYIDRDLPKETIFKIDFFPFFLRMLEIGAYMVLNGFVHNDLHTGNITMKDARTPRLIDFGRSYQIKYVTPELVQSLAGKYAPQLKQLTPESVVQDGIDQYVNFQQMLEDLRVKKPVRWVEQVLGVSRRAQVDEFRTFWKTSKAAQRRDWVRMCKLYWPAVDAWAIGVLLLEILHRNLFNKNFTDSAQWKQKRSVVKTVLRGLLRTSPFYRMDCVEALAIFDPMNDLITSGRGRTWLERKIEQRERATVARGGGATVVSQEGGGASDEKWWQNLPDDEIDAESSAGGGE